MQVFFKTIIVIINLAVKFYDIANSDEITHTMSEYSLFGILGIFGELFLF